MVVAAAAGIGCGEYLSFQPLAFDETWRAEGEAEEPAIEAHLPS